VTTRSGIPLTWDTVETVQTFDPDYQPSSGSSIIGLAFLLDTPAEVDANYEQLVAVDLFAPLPRVG
jgi:hypothetical protein